VSAPHSQSQELSLEERIRQRAYEIHLRRGGAAGSDRDDWLQAEREILRAQQENAIDEASEESFPASDPPAR
jgi:hypothetical protein